MADRPMVRVEGLSTLLRTLRATEKELEFKKYTGPLADVMKEAGEIAAGEIRGQAPKRTGKLAKSVRAGKSASRARVSVGRKTVPYAGPIHWGWPARHIEANEFGTRGLQMVDPRIEDMFAGGVDELLKKIQGV